MKADFAVAKQVGDAFAHRNPFGVALGVTQDPLTYTEFLGIVDDGFHPKNETGLVVHLEPVLFDTVFDSRSAGAPADQARQIGHDLALEFAMQLTSKEIHDLLGAKARCG